MNTTAHVNSFCGLPIERWLTAAILLLSIFCNAAQAVPLTNGTWVTLAPGVGSGTNQTCTSGSCFGLEVAPGFDVWTNISPGTDGGLILGKNQKSGGQDVGASGSNRTPGEVTAAWLFFGNYGTFSTAPVVESQTGATTADASANIFNDSSCSGAACIGVTQLGAWHFNWNGLVYQIGSANGCTSAACTPDQMNGIFVSQWTVGADKSYLLDYSNSFSDATAYMGVHFKLILRGRIEQVPAVRLPDGTRMSLEAGVGSDTNVPCAIGSCFGVQAAPGLVFWSNIAPGTDGGFILGKNQKGGGQDVGSSAVNNTPGELTAAFPFLGNFGTFSTVPAISASSTATSDASTNRFYSQSCTGASCNSLIQLGAWNWNWNGQVFEIGGANGCASTLCTPDQLNGLFVEQWTVGADRSYLLDYNITIPDNNAFAGVYVRLLLRGKIEAALGPAPRINGFWPGAGPQNSVVFVFGKNFKTPDRTQPILKFNGIRSYVTQALTDDLILTLVPAGDTTGPITVETQTGSPPVSLGITTSPTNFGVASTALGINGFWPGEGSTGKFVFVFGSGFVPNNTQVAINGVNASLVQVLDSGLLVFQLPCCVANGFISVTTPAGTVTSSAPFIVLPGGY